MKCEKAASAFLVCAAIAQPPRAQPALDADPPIAFRAAGVGLAAIESRAPIRLDARAAIVHQELRRGVRPPDAVDDVRHTRHLIQLRRQRLDFRIAVAPLGGRDIAPVAHRVESQRLRLVANRLGAAVLPTDQQRLESDRESEEFLFLPGLDVDERHRQTALRAGQ